MIKLPISMPIISCYQHHAVGHSIINSYVSEIEYLAWICDNYIQVKYRKDLEIDADFYTTAIDLISPLLVTQYLTRTSVSMWNNDIIFFVINNLEAERYIYVPINTKYITAYNKQVYHPILIYGYDDKKRIFYAGDYFTNKFSFEEIPFVEFRAAYNNVEEDQYWWDGLKLITYNKKANYKYDKENVIKLFEDYLYSNNTGIGDRFDICGNRTKYYFGIKIYDWLINILKYSSSDPTCIDIRVYSVLIEHKRVIKLVSKYALPDVFDCVLRLEIENIENKCKILQNLVLKFSCSLKPYVQQKCIDKILEIQNLEKAYLIKLVLMLKT